MVSINMSQVFCLRSCPFLFYQIHYIWCLSVKIVVQWLNEGNVGEKVSIRGDRRGMVIWSKGEERNENVWDDMERDEGKKGKKPWSSGRLVHLLEERVPCSCVEMATPVFIESMPRTTVFFGDVERLRRRLY